ncbi:MAG: chloride channel protein [Acidimicrobiales bacterium]
MPLAEAWYRRQLLAAVFLGVFGGVFALVFSAVTTWSIDRLYGDAASDPWSGEWWWIALTAGGAVLVAAMRKALTVPDDVPGAIAMAKTARVDPELAPRLVIISVVSLITGASLGPSFAIVVAGGGMGTWVVERHRRSEPEAEAQYTLTGMSGAFGGVFTSPLFASILISELSPIKKMNYVAAFIPQFLAASIGYAIFFGVTDETMLAAFEVGGGYSFEKRHLLLGVLLGVFAAFTLLVYAVVGQLVRGVVARVKIPWLNAAVGGGLIGLVAFALPLTATGGSTQLTYTADNAATLGTGLLIAVLLGKMVAMTLSQEVGFLGGTVFPILFVGGTSGALVHAIFPDIPAALAIAAMIAAVPGTVISAPVSFILIGVGGVALGTSAIAPVGIAVITAYLAISTVRFFKTAQDSM